MEDHDTNSHDQNQADPVVIVFDGQKSDKDKIENCVIDLKSKGYDKSRAFAICTNAVKKASEGKMPELKFNDKVHYIAEATKLLSQIGIEERQVAKFSADLFKSMPLESCDTIVKALQESKSTKAHIGTTSADGEKAHDHNYALIILNYGQQVVGITTSTKKDKDHIHTINFVVDNKMRDFSGYVDYAMVESKDETANDFHRHLISVAFEEIMKSVNSIYTKANYYSETTKTDTAEKKNKIQDIANGKPFDNKRYAELIIAEVSQMSEKPEWLEGTLESLQDTLISRFSAEYSESHVLDDSHVAELADRKLDPKAQVRNRPAPIFPANSPDITDKKDHFPIDTIGRARNALARVAQFDKVPTWYKGTLAALQKKVRQAVKAKWPSINSKTMNEVYSIRCRGNGSAFFLNCATSDIEIAKGDAEVYLNSCPSYRIDLVKFTLDDEGKREFSEIGALMFYDKDSKGLIEATSEEPITLSEKDTEGNTVIEILRTGKFNHPQYGKFDIQKEKLSEIINNFNSNVLDRNISFDFNHEPDLPAAAWCKKLSIDRRNIKGNMQDVLKAHVQWTPRGEEAIKNKDYLYFSSEYVDSFMDKETSKRYGTTLRGGGLTNRPWIPGLKPIELSENKKQIAFIKNN